MEEGDEEVDVGTVSVSSELVEHSSPSASDKQCSSVTIDQMVRDFIIAKTIGIKGSGDHGVDSVKAGDHCRKGHHKLNKDKKKKKKKKKHKSHRKDGSLKHGRHHHHHGDRRSEDASSESNSGDNNKEQHKESSTKDTIGERRSVEPAETSKKNVSPLTPIKQSEECRNRSATSPKSYNSSEAKHVLLTTTVCSKCSHCMPVNTISERKMKTGEVQCHCQSVVNNKNETDLPQCKEGDTLAKSITSKSDGECRTHHTNSKTNASTNKCVTEAHRHTNESRKLTKQDNIISVPSKSQQYTDNNKVSECGKKQHSSASCRHGQDVIDCDKSGSSRRNSPSLEKISDRHSLLAEDCKSDDVVFVKKVSGYELCKSSSSRETLSNMEKSSREQKLSWGSSRSVRKRSRSKCRYDDESSDDEEVSVSRSKSKKDRRHAKDSPPVILLSDDDIDILSDEMVEKLHKRLTTSIQKSKELQAERDQTVALANSETVSEPSATHSSELIDEHCDSVNVQTDAVSDFIIPPSDSANVDDTSHCELASTDEQSAAKSTALGLLGKKTLKFGLKISESSAAWISKGIKCNKTTGKKVQSCYML